MTDDSVDEACGSKCKDGSWGAGCTLPCADPKTLSNCDLAVVGMLVCSPYPPRRRGKALLGALLRGRASADTYPYASPGADTHPYAIPGADTHPLGVIRAASRNMSEGLGRHAQVVCDAETGTPIACSQCLAGFKGPTCQVDRQLPR